MILYTNINYSDKQCRLSDNHVASWGFLGGGAKINIYITGTYFIHESALLISKKSKPMYKCLWLIFIKLSPPPKKTKVTRLLIRNGFLIFRS